jgi:hypothetical protein
MTNTSQTVIEKDNIKLILSCTDPEAVSYSMSKSHRDLLDGSLLERVFHDEDRTFFRVPKVYSSRVVFSTGAEVVNDTWQGFGVRLVTGQSCTVDDGNGNLEIKVSRVLIGD